MVRLQKMETDFVKRIQRFYRGHMARVAARRYVKRSARLVYALL